MVYLVTQSIAHIMLRRMVGWLTNNELEMELNEAVVASFKVLSRHLPGGTEENQDKPHSW
jgi:hypothetical protein